MLISELILKNYRNLDVATAPGRKFNLIIGENGLGKSNYIDAIYNLAQGHSFKRYLDGHNINHHKQVDFARIDAKLINEEERQMSIIFSQINGRNMRKFKVNDLPTTRRKFVSHLQVVLFTPQTLSLIDGGPEVRREELDEFLADLDFNYAAILAEYKEVVRNRNRLLANIWDGRANVSQLGFWNQKLLELGSQIVAFRQTALREFLPVLKDTAKTLFAQDLSDIDLKYLSRLVTEAEDVKTRFAKLLEENQQKELASKKSLYGPHRDDYEFFQSGRSLKVFGSRGQQRLIAMILKIAMWEYLSKVKADKALLLLDDILSELDPQNRAKLSEVLSQLDTQTFISGTEEHYFEKKLLQEGKRIDLA